MPLRGCTCLKCTNQVECAMLVQLQLYWCTSCSVGAVETTAPLDCPLRFPFACKVMLLLLQAKRIFPNR